MILDIQFIWHIISTEICKLVCLTIWLSTSICCNIVFYNVYIKILFNIIYIKFIIKTLRCTLCHVYSIVCNLTFIITISKCWILDSICSSGIIIKWKFITTICKTIYKNYRFSIFYYIWLNIRFIRTHIKFIIIKSYKIINRRIKICWSIYYIFICFLLIFFYQWIIIKS